MTFQPVPGQVKLHNIPTLDVVSDDIEIGTKAYETLRKEHFVEK